MVLQQQPGLGLQQVGQGVLAPANNNANNGNANLRRQAAAARALFAQLQVGLLPPQPFQIPTDHRYLNPVTGRIQCIVRRERHPRLKELAGDSANQWIVCRTQAIPNVCQSNTLFLAEREAGGNYRIYNVYGKPNNNEAMAVDNQDDLVGMMSRLRHRRGGFVEYKLQTTHDKKLVSSTIYDTTSLSYPVEEGYPNRIAHSIIHDDTVPTAINNKSIKLRAPSRAKAYFDGLQKPVISHTGEDIHQALELQEELKVFQSKRRFTNWRGRSKHWDVEGFAQKFNGRAVLPSKKNMQIMDTSSGKVLLQMGRLNQKDFSLDFLPPYTPFQAFGFALAQLEANS